MHDLGPGFDLAPILADDAVGAHGRGLLVVSRVAEKLATVAKGGRGSKVSAVMPVERNSF